MEAEDAIERKAGVVAVRLVALMGHHWAEIIVQPMRQAVDRVQHQLLPPQVEVGVVAGPDQSVVVDEDVVLVPQVVPKEHDTNPTPHLHYNYHMSKLRYEI